MEGRYKRLCEVTDEGVSNRQLMAGKEREARFNRWQKAKNVKTYSTTLIIFSHDKSH